jgi:hypothetical protein
MTRRRWILPALVAVALVALGASLASAQGDDERRGTDPLSAEEQQAALDAAGLVVGGGGGDAVGPESGSGDEMVLLVERHEEEKADAESGARRADVYVYSYEDDSLTRTVVDLASGEVDDTESAQNVQLPLVAEEADRALELALADAEFVALLEEQHQAATGRPLGDPATDLEIQPMVFRADALPAVANGAAAECGVHRCAQLMIATPDDVLIDLLPIIDLSADRLVARNGFFG